jgi:NAD(P)-dependent dehydrogenase (short-subunit alcohol dehydrogenase family)
MVAKTSKFSSASSRLPALTLSPGRLLFSSQFTKPQLPPNDLNLSGQTVIVTGANNGIGFACAKLLLQRGVSHLIIAVRSEAKGRDAAEQLSQVVAGAKVEVWRLDMGSYISIDEFVKRCETLPRLDGAILNAGMGNPSLQINESTGHEGTMQVNFLSTMYLSVLLLPILKNKSPPSKPGRLTVVSSGSAMHCELPEAKSDPLIPAFDSEATYDGMSHYAKSKLLGQLFIDKLARYVDPQDVIINCVDPGLTKGTGLMDKSPIVLKIVMTIMMRLLGRTQEQAASTYIDAAIIKGDETHGSYLMDWRIYP